MGDDTDRPQDGSRRHRRTGAASTETATLLAEYQEAMRAELRAVLAEQRGRLPAGGLLPPAPGEPAPELIRPGLGDRVRLWDLAIKLGRELATEIDPRPPVAPGEPGKVVPMRKRGRVEYGPDQ